MSLLHLLWKSHFLAVPSDTFYKRSIKTYITERLPFISKTFIPTNCMAIIIIFRSTSEVRFSAFLSPNFCPPCRIQALYYIAQSSTGSVCLRYVSIVLFFHSLAASLGKIAYVAQYSQQATVFHFFYGGMKFCGMMGMEAEKALGYH